MTKNAVFSSRILGEYSALLIITYNSKLIGTERYFFDYVKGMKYKPTKFNELFECCMWSDVSNYVETANSSLELTDNLTSMLINLTITFVYPKNKFRFSVVSNISPLISEFFGDFVLKYGTKNLNLRR